MRGKHCLEKVTKEGKTGYTVILWRLRFDAAKSNHVNNNECIKGSIRCTAGADRITINIIPVISSGCQLLMSFAVLLQYLVC